MVVVLKRSKTIDMMHPWGERVLDRNLTYMNRSNTVLEVAISCGKVLYVVGTKDNPGCLFRSLPR